MAHMDRMMVASELAVCRDLCFEHPTSRPLLAVSDSSRVASN